MVATSAVGASGKVTVTSGHGHLGESATVGNRVGPQRPSCGREETAAPVTRPALRRNSIRGLTAVGLLLVLSCGGESTPTPSTPDLPPPAAPQPEPEPEPPPPDPTVVMAVKFDTTPLGEYTRAAFDADFPTHRWVNMGRGLVEIVEGPAAYSGRSVRIKFPAGTFGNDHAFKSIVDFPRTYDELYVSYRVRFEEGFDFVRGGKLPGFFRRCRQRRW